MYEGGRGKILLLLQLHNKGGVQHPTNSIKKTEVQTDCEKRVWEGVWGLGNREKEC